MADIQGRIGRLEVEMEQVQVGVANFRQFQVDARHFFTEFKTNEANKEKTDSKRARFHYFLLTLLSGLIVGMFVFLLNHYDGKKVSLFAEPSVQSSQQPPQDAGGPTGHY